MTRILRGLGLVACAAVIPAVSLAVVPDPDDSVTPGCIRTDPSGALSLDVQVIGTDGNPLGGNDVRMIFSTNGDCANLVADSPTCNHPGVLTDTADGSGNASFSPAVGGCCATAGAVTIEADPGAVTLLPVYDNVGSNDNNGDGQSNLSDFVAFQASFLSADSCNDLVNCDVNVNLADFVTFQSLFLNGTECP